MAAHKERAPRGDRRYAANRSIADQARLDMMKAVRAACRRQGIDDDSRKAIQADRIGKASMADMTVAELGRLLDHLNRHWDGPMGHRAHLGKIKALWWTLYWLGEIGDPSEHAMSAFVERQTGVSALRFLDHRKAASVIEALKSWAARVGVEWPTPERSAAMERDQGIAIALHDRHAVLDALSRRLRDRAILNTHYSTYLAGALGLGLNHWMWTARELDAGIRLLGKRLRREAGKDAA